MNILLTIKDSTLLELVAKILEKHGHNVTRTVTVEEALALIPTIEIELLVASLNMEPSGAEPIVQAARRRNPGLPVVLIAGSLSSHDRERIGKMHAVFWQTGGDIQGLAIAIKIACASDASIRALLRELLC